MSSILTCGPFLHRIPTIQSRREGTYLSIEMSNEGNHVDGGRQQNFKTNTYFRGPQGRSAKMLTLCLVLHKDHNERLNESKLVKYINELDL
jgi:hypothetical protein